MHKKRNIIGKVFGRLTVLSLDHRADNGNLHYNCQCSCGVIKIINRRYLIDGGTTSCGCFRSENSIRISTKHGGHKTREHKSWESMKSRCYNINNKDYSRYGGRGIIVCPEWNGSFPRFLSDMGSRPIGMTLDRIDVNGNYDQGNCKWSTLSEQAVNKRNSILVQFKGSLTPIKDIAASHGFHVNTIASRVRRGWSEDDLVVPLKRQP